MKTLAFFENIQSLLLKKAKKNIFYEKNVDEKTCIQTLTTFFLQYHHQS